MKVSIYPSLSNIILIFFFCLSFSFAAFEGNYTFQLETATQEEIDGTSIPRKGMMVYNTTSSEINYYNGISWIVLSPRSIYDTNGLVTSDREVDLNSGSLDLSNGNIGIGDASPDATLDVAGSFRLDGALEDKDGDTGTVAQVLTSTGVSTDWTSSVSAPNISNSTISMATSTTATITLTGSNFIPSSVVTIPGFNGTINSTNVVSPTEIQVNISTSTSSTFDIVVSNNGILNTQWQGNGVDLLQVN